MLASLAQLEKCHRRHDDEMEKLLAAARRLAAGRPDGNDVEVVRDAVAYFREAITRHFLDEEGSLFPRLSTRRPELAEQLASLSSEHPAQVRMQEQIAEIAEQLDGDSRQGDGKSLLEITEQLEKAHRAHVAREDHVFTLAASALTADDDRDIVHEMTTRRERNSTSEMPVMAPRRQRSETRAETPSARRAPTKKPAAKKPAAKKPAAKKPAVKKRAVKKPAAKTRAAKKPARKKR